MRRRQWGWWLSLASFSGHLIARSDDSRSARYREIRDVSSTNDDMSLAAYQIQLNESSAKWMPLLEGSRL